MGETIYPVYLRVESTVLVLWTSVEKLRGIEVSSLVELHALEAPYGVTRGVPVG